MRAILTSRLVAAAGLAVLLAISACDGTTTPSEPELRDQYVLATVDGTALPIAVSATGIRVEALLADTLFFDATRKQYTEVSSVRVDSAGQMMMRRSQRPPLAWENRGDRVRVGLPAFVGGKGVGTTRGLTLEVIDDSARTWVYTAR